MPKPKSVVVVPAAQAISELARVLTKPDPIRAKLPGTIEIFCVGGAVRDALLGQASADRDFVVVGAQIDDMLAAGFTPVGKDFPVFLHPISHDEYALARTERKSGKGYKGFVFNAAPSVTLHDDLSRRDLTINAIAMNAAGELIDPFHGCDDLQAKVLRHVGPAFSEDPVRLLRIARFASRWPDFVVAPETMALCKSIVAAGEARELVAERVWQEIQKGLMEDQPAKMLAMLTECGAWRDLHPSVVAPQPATLAALNQAAMHQQSLEIRYALLVFNDGASQPVDFLKAPRHCLELADLCIAQSQPLTLLRAALKHCDPTQLDVIFNWISSADVVRKSDRFSELLQVLQLTHRLTPEEARLLEEFARQMTSADANEAVARAAQEAQRTGQSIAAATRLARQNALKSHPQFNKS